MKQVRRLNLLMVALLVAVLGAILVVGSHAASPYASVTANKGTPITPAKPLADNTASDGQAVQFGDPNLLWSDDFSSGSLASWNNQSCPSGVTIVRSPVRDPGGYAAKFTVSDSDTNANCSAVPTENPRAQLTSNFKFYPGDDRYIAFSTYFPADFPTISSPDWLQFAEIYGPPYGGSPSMGFDMYGNRIMFYTGVAGYGQIWTSSNDIPKGTAWEDIVLHVKFSTDPTVGFVELWLNGVQQTFKNGSTRFYYDTITPGLNDGGSNRLYLNQYRSVLVPLGTVTLYHADARVGTTYDSVAF